MYVCETKNGWNEFLQEECTHNFFKNILIICLWVNAKWICFISKILYHKFKDLNRNVDIFLYNCSFKEI